VQNGRKFEPENQKPIASQHGFFGCRKPKGKQELAKYPPKAGEQRIFLQIAVLN